jgi:L-ribulose-5-phosphate 3-epimerase
MILAISTCYDYRVEFGKSLDHISRAGFKAISLGGKTAHSNYHKPEGRKAIAVALERTGLTIDSIHAPFGSMADLTQSEEVLRHSAVEDIKKCIAACKEVGAGIAILHLNSHRTDGISQRLKSVRMSLSELIEFAGKNCVKLAAENLPGDNSLIILKYALDMFDSEVLGLCFDNGHAELHKDAFGLLDQHQARLLALHLHDNDGQADLHQLPFEGKCNLPNLAAQLNKSESICPITIESEVTNSSYKAPESFLTAAFSAGMKFGEMIK